MRPYRHELHHGWDKWWAYDGGGLCYGVTGWGTHSFDQIQRALGTDETGPVEMVLEEAVRDEPCGKFETVTEVDETRLDYLIRTRQAGRRTPGQGPHVVCRRDRTSVASGWQLGTRPGRHLHRRRGQTGNQPQQDRGQSQGATRTIPPTPARSPNRRRSITLKTGCDASRPASDATPTSNMVYGRRRWVTSSTSSVKSAGLARGCIGIRRANGSPIVTKPTSRRTSSGRDEKATSCRT